MFLFCIAIINCTLMRNHNEQQTVHRLISLSYEAGKHNECNSLEWQWPLAERRCRTAWSQLECQDRLLGEQTEQVWKQNSHFNHIHLCCSYFFLICSFTEEVYKAYLSIRAMMMFLTFTCWWSSAQERRNGFRVWRWNSSGKTFEMEWIERKQLCRAGLY